MIQEPATSNMTLESIITDKRNAIKYREEAVARLENELNAAKVDLEKDRIALQTLISIRDDEIAKAKSAQTGQQLWTISTAAADTLRKIPIKKAHADQILLHFAEYGLAVSKAALTSQLAKDRHLFLPLGGNVFQLIEPGLSKSLPEFVAATTQDTNRAFKVADNVPLGSKAINLLQETEQPHSTGEIKSVLVARGLAEDNKNLFPWLHTALKRKEDKGEVILGEDKKWRLPEWINKEKEIEEMKGENAPEQV